VRRASSQWSNCAEGVTLRPYQFVRSSAPRRSGSSEVLPGLKESPCACALKLSAVSCSTLQMNTKLYLKMAAKKMDNTVFKNDIGVIGLRIAVSQT